MKIMSYLRQKYNSYHENKNRRYLNNLVKLGLKLGEDVEIIAIHTCLIDPSHCYLISIGDNCTLAPGVHLIAHDASTKKFLGYTKIGKIDIGDNCFIGDSVIVLPSVTIGAGSIIGAGSVVTRDIPSGVVAAGNPAKVICPIDVYLNKTKKIANAKKIFSEEYFIENLDFEKRIEIQQSVEKSFGFIV